MVATKRGKVWQGGARVARTAKKAMYDKTWKAKASDDVAKH